MTAEPDSGTALPRVGLILDHLSLPRWQAEALAKLHRDTEFLLYSCTNAAPRPKRLRHGLYYLLNLLAIRGPLTRLVPVQRAVRRICRLREFESEREGAWQRLPDALLEGIAADRPDVIVKLGMGLMRVPPPERLAAPILSYHHGDPDSYRGRPAGFYETLHGRSAMGQIVQRLTDRLDAGPVHAFAETPIHPESYRRTVRDAFRHSPLLLGPAIRNAMSGRRLDKSSDGRNYRLPGNLLVIRFGLVMAAAWVKWVFSGAFLRKAWQVSTARVSPSALCGGEDAALPPPARWTHVPRPRGYSFIADPFFHPTAPGYLVEGMNARTGNGEILHVSASRAVGLSDPAQHHSYPFVVAEDGAFYIVPEIGQWSPPRLFRLEDGGMVEAGPLQLPSDTPIADPSLLKRPDGYYLFANLAVEGNSVLRLWRAESLVGPYREHPESPVRISPVGGRMAGALFEHEGQLIRLGQDSSRSYGDGLVVFRIDEIGPRAYRETRIGTLRFERVHGPHTINFRGGEAVFDWYRQRFSLTAGVERLRARAAIRRRLIDARKGASSRS